MADIRTSSFGGIPSGNTAARPGSPVIGDTYYNGTLELLEIYNGTQWVASSSPPSAPTIISVTDVGTGLAYATGGTFTVVVSPDVNSSTPTQYNVLVPNTLFSATSSSTTISLTGLTSNTSFQVAAQSQNNFGASTNSAISSAVTATTVPQSPIIGTASASTTTTDVTITWTLGNNGGKELTAITITPYLNGNTAGTPQNAATTSATSMTFTGLTQGSAYTFKVKATNANGTGLESSATNSVTIATLVQVDYLVIAGGGGGGFDYGGGGGAGGLRSSVTATGGGGTVESSLSMGILTNYTVTIGAGGASSSSTGQPGGNGIDTTFFTITSTGGGGGGSRSFQTGAGQLGGSGGGGGYSGGAGGSGTANQGFAGASAQNINSGGGGGAGAVGTRSPSLTGGAGIANSITGSSVNYAGGGDVTGDNTATSVTFGGGVANSSTRNGTANKGGGGAGNQGLPGGASGSGGSGVVILRYPDTRTITFGAGVTGTESSASGGYKRATITAGSGNVSWS
jgi:hypothetical protein